MKPTTRISLAISAAASPAVVSPDGDGHAEIRVRTPCPDSGSHQC